MQAHRIICALWLGMLLWPIAASAEVTPAMSQRMNAIADAWIAQVAPNYVNHCVGEKMQYSYVFLDSNVLGVADGWVLQDNVWVWDHTKCQSRIQPKLGLEHQCEVRAHEKMHFVLGPKHEGPLALETEMAPGCHFLLTRYEKTVLDIRQSFLSHSNRPWRVNCNKKVTLCVAKSKGARYKRYFDIDYLGGISEAGWELQTRTRSK